MPPHAPPPSAPPLLLTERQVAAALAVSIRTVRDLAKAGELPRVRIGARSTRYRPVDVETLIERGTSRAPSDTAYS